MDTSHTPKSKRWIALLFFGRVGLLGIGTAVWFALAAWEMMRLLHKESLEPGVRGDVS